MEKTLVAFLVVAGLALSTDATLTCKSNPVNVGKEWITMEDDCLSMMRTQIQKEVNASMQYLAMGAHFSRDTVNRPGFAKLFFEAASEERQHAMKLIEYLLMRGGELLPVPNSGVKNLIKIYPPTYQSWESGSQALIMALQLEANVTISIRQVIEKCETSQNKVNDYHLVDYLTGEFLEEQYKGQRDLAGKASTLEKMMKTNGVLGEFLFDKKLLNGELLSH